MADATMNELRQRMTRIESRLCRIADALHINVGSPDKELEVLGQLDNVVDIETPALDLTLSEIIRFLTKAGIEASIVNVYFRRKLVATVHIPE